MPNRYHPLQPGDRVQTSTPLFDDSVAADRRPTSQSGLANPPGENAAPGHSSPSDSAPLWKVGQVHPNSFLSAPFPVVRTEGDTSGQGTTIHMLDICEYGDTWDPTAPIRTREVGSDWQVDVDNDGTLN